jgi:hypothetical protein
VKSTSDLLAEQFIQQCCDYAPYQSNFIDICKEIENVIHEKTIYGDDDASGYWEMTYVFGPNDLPFIDDDWWRTYYHSTESDQQNVKDYLKHKWPDTWRE